MRLPEPLTFTEGAGVLVTGLTAIACVEDAGQVAPGDRVLVQSAAGATGLGEWWTSCWGVGAGLVVRAARGE